MKALNSGWPFQGVDLNSGWNCTPMNQGVDVLRQLHDFGELLALRERRDHEAGLAQLVQVVHVGFIAVAMALGDHIAVDAVRQRVLGHVRALRAQAHGATQVGVLVAGLDGAVGVLPLGDQRDHGVGRGGVELGAVGVGQAGHMAGVFDGGHLHAQADAQVGHLALAGKLGRGDLAFHAALAEATGHQDGVVLGQFGGCVGAVDGFGIDMVDLHAHMVAHAGVAQGFVDGLIAVRQVHVLTDHGDGDFALGVLGLVHQIVPALEAGGRGVQAQLVADQAVQALLVQHAGHLVDGVHVPHADHAPFGHVGEQRNFGALFFRDAAVGAAQQGVGLDADLAQLLHGVLGGLGLEFARCRNPGQVGQVHKGGVVRAHAQAHLAHGFEEWQRFDVAHGAADFDDGHVHGIGRADAGAALDEFLDLVGDVGDDLYGLAQVVAAAFLLQHGLVNLARGEVIGFLHARFDETLVVAQIQVGFCAVIGHEHLAVLERRHGARVYVDVGVKLDEGDFESPRFEDRGKGG
ncbi:hypothetical protein QF021_000770 [Acidovorax delafieldii]|nr:hypothetical protein [Acidovorax delafieldii]